MDIKKFVLSFYKKATENFYVDQITEPENALSPHSHEYFQIYYVKEGRIFHHLDKSVAELSPGDVFVLPPNVAHHIEKATEKLRFFVISFMPEFLTGIVEGNKFVADFIHYLLELTNENVQPKFTLCADDVIFSDTLILRIMNEFSNNDTGKEALIKSSLSLLLSIFARAYFEEKVESVKFKSDLQAILHCKGYIDNHLKEPILLSEMAKRTAMSKSTFCETFKSVVGTPFKKYLNFKRIEKAAALIKSGKKISTAARDVGYDDFSTFYRNFKKQLGVSPEKYKKLNV